MIANKTYDIRSLNHLLSSDKTKLLRILPHWVNIGTPVYNKTLNVISLKA